MTGSLPTQGKEQVVAVVTLVRNALTDIDRCHRHKDGGLQEITFSRLGITADCARLALEVDMLRLPPRVTVTRLASANTAHHLELVTEYGPDLGLVRADPGLIEQVLLNLMTNARDAILGAGTTTIQSVNIDVSQVDGGSTAPGSCVMIAVSDTGTGIDAAVLPRIFEPFFTTKENGFGTGLGLSAVYDIVRQRGVFLSGGRR